MANKSTAAEKQWTINEIRKVIDAGLASDALDYFGYKHQTLQDPFLAPLDPEDTIVGYAYPVQAEVVHNAPEVPLVREFRSIDQIGKDQVYIITGRDEQFSCPLLGEMLGLALQVRGAAGAVLNGPVRDVKGILSHHFPVISRGKLPTSSKGRAEVTAWNTTIQIHGVDIHPGDLVVADIDGVTIVPAVLINQVADRCVAIRANESVIREKIAAGVPTEEAYPQIGGGLKKGGEAK